MTDYSRYQYMTVEINDGIALVTLNRPEVLNATNHILHNDLTKIWGDLDRDPDVRVIVVTGAGRAFSAGGDITEIEERAKMSKGELFEAVMQTQREARDIVYNIINCEKVIISAINGVAVGAGLAVAICADISIMAETARITDGHIRLGVAAGDHAAIIWPLLCGMAKSKLYLLTADFLDGKEAERIGLVSKAVPQDQVLPTAMEYARKLANGPQHAIRFTKRSLNQWLRLGGVASFDYSLALEMLNFFDVDVEAGVRGLNTKSEPQFPSVKK
ncbi:MAG TPA: enoyl-CoA hydratase/isomerase family protein [Dehalococcoidia bacterium]|nr:enoyl-CoA hydratase/isomerase family protein [Dehalococcoidia bacterium]